MNNKSQQIGTKKDRNETGRRKDVSILQMSFWMHLTRDTSTLPACTITGVSDYCHNRQKAMRKKTYKTRHIRRKHYLSPKEIDLQFTSSSKTYPTPSLNLQYIYSDWMDSFLARGWTQLQQD